jgi:hypothetical protein
MFNVFQRFYGLFPGFLLPAVLPRLDFLVEEVLLFVEEVLPLLYLIVL